MRRFLVPGVLIILVLLAGLAGLLERAELYAYDGFFKVRGARPAPQDIVVVAVDDRSIAEIGLWPWPRRVHAALLERLSGARVVGFDVLFDTPGTPEDNAFLAKAVKKHGRVVLAAMFSFEERGGILYQVPHFPVRELSAAARGIGFVNTPEDPDGVVRSVVLQDTNTFGRPFPAFGLAVWLAEEGLSPDALALRPAPGGRFDLEAGGRVVPLDAKNRLLLDFWGPGGTFATYSCADVLAGRVDPAEFAGKTVLVGVTTAAGHDYKSTPFARGNLVLSGALPSPGVEIHASALATLHEKSWYTQAPAYANAAFLVLAGILAAAAARCRRGPYAGAALTLAVMAAAALAAYLAWSGLHLWLNVAGPLAAAVLCYTGTTAEELVRTELERRKTRALFSRYVPKDVVEEILKRPEEVQLGGARAEVTVLFSDVRGFTSFSEDKPPEYVVGRLNEYFTVMTAVIFRHGGTLDKYLGDGLMAFFGAPVPCDDHADRALAAALDMLDELAALNDRWRAAGEPAFDIGIGINSGPVVVGNVGSPERMDYTIMGGEVNLASRLEGLNKQYGTSVIFSERTLVYVRRPQNLPPVVFLGRAAVRGLAAPVGIYTFDRAGQMS